jgi:hypothetical protein
MRQALETLANTWVEVGVVVCTIFVFSRGDIVRLWPVHASSAFRCATIQSSLPSRWTTTSDVHFDFVDIRAV